MFSYTGKDIEAPLSALLDHLREQETTIRAALRRYAHTDEREFFAWASQQSFQGGASEVERHSLAKSLVGVLVAMRETELWVYESRRTPTATWTLTMADLAKMRPPAIPLTATLPEKSPKLSLWRRWFRLP